MSLEKEFVPYEEALTLKELGFDEKCFCNWEESWSPEPEHEIKMVLTTDQTWLRPGWVCAPTFSQAFRWFREKHKIRHTITDFIDDKEGIEWDYEIAVIGTDVDEKGNYVPLVDYSTDDKNRKFKSYEEAELACLRKLIEIVKQK